MEEQEVKERRTAFREELVALCGKHNVKKASFCGTMGDEFVALFCAGEVKAVSDVTEAVMNVGRLWQHARMMVKKMLDEFEREW